MASNWHLFANAYTAIVAPLVAAIQAMLGNVVGTARPLALAGVTLWMALIGIDVALGQKKIEAFLRDMLLAIAAIGLLAGPDVYIQYVSNLFLQEIPNTVSAALGGNTNPVDGIDNVLTDAVKAALKTYKALPKLSFMSIPLGLGVIGFILVALVATCFSFGVYMIAVVTAALAVIIGPIFVALGAVPFTRKYTIGWLSVLVSSVTIQLLSIAVLQLLSQSELTTLGQMTTALVANGEPADQLWGLARCGALLFLCGIIIKQLPALSFAIAGGVFHNVSAAHAATFGVAGKAASTAGNGAANATTAVGGAAVGGARAAGTAISNWRSSTPTGPSLSKGKP
nr:type IV secretion system protein [uncultured Rhodopila sp.]